MKKLLTFSIILLLFMISCVMIISCADRDAIPAAIIYTREIEMPEIITTENANILDIIKETETTVTETTVTETIITETTTELIVITELPADTIDIDIITVLVNLNSKTFHADLNCRHIKSMNEENKGEYTGTIDEIKSAGYKPCGTCSKEYKD